VRVAMVRMQNLRRPVVCTGLATGSYFRHPPSCISTERLPTPRILNCVDDKSMSIVPLAVDKRCCHGGWISPSSRW